MSTPKKKVKRRLRWGRVIPIVLIVAVLIGGTVVFAKYKSAKKELEEGGSRIAVAEKDDQVIGFCKINTDGSTGVLENLVVH